VYNETSSSRILRRLTTLSPSEFLEEHAEEPGVVEWEGKLQISVLVWALVFGSRLRRSRTLAGFRRSEGVIEQFGSVEILLVRHHSC
jgi:putative transposase